MNLAKILTESTEDLAAVNRKSDTIEGNVPHDFEYLRISTSNKISTTYPSHQCNSSSRP